MTANASSSPVGSPGGLAVLDEVCLPIGADADIVAACEQARQLAVEAGFQKSDVVVIVAAISEGTRNIVAYAASGELILRAGGVNGKALLVFIAKDDGTGIPDIRLALENGNVPELRNLIERGILTAEGDKPSAEHLPGEGSARPSAGPLPSLQEMEARHIARVLAYTAGQVGEAARILGIHRNTLTRKVREYGL